ncbi:MAG: amidohydrolase family protein [Halobacteriota archaeon]
MSDAYNIDRDFPIVDFGGHMVTEVTPSMEPEDEVVGPIHTDPDLIVERYEAAGVDYVVLSQPPFMGSDDPEATAESNDDLFEIVDAYDQFFGLAALPTAAGGEVAAEEFERCLEMGYNGGGLETMSGGNELTDEELVPVFEVAEKYDAPVFVHPKLHKSLQIDTEVDDSAREVLSDEYRLNAIFGREAALSESICKVIQDGTLDRHPDLNLVYHHCGGNIASMLGRVHLHTDIGRWPGMENMKSFKEFKQQLEERIYIDTSGFFGYHAPVRASLEQLPSSQVVFGTDAPYEPRNEEELQRFWTSITDVASEEDAARVLGGNALDLMANTE